MSIQDTGVVSDFAPPDEVTALAFDYGVLQEWVRSFLDGRATREQLADALANSERVA